VKIFDCLNSDGATTPLPHDSFKKKIKKL